MKEVVFFDLDNTIVDGFTHSIFARYLFRKKIIGVRVLLVAGFLLTLYKAGIIKNPKKPYEFGLSYAKGHNVAEAKEIIKDFYTSELSNKIFPKIKKIISGHIMSGRKVVIISNQGDLLVKDVAESLGIMDCICTKIELDQNGNLTGKIEGDIVYSSRKKSVAEEFLIRNNLVGAYTWGYADHFSDVELLRYVSKPVAVNPDSKLRKLALKNTWEILEKKDLY